MREVFVKRGDRVREGDLLALVSIDQQFNLLTLREVGGVVIL